MIVTNKSLVPNCFYSTLDDLLSKSQKEVKLMLKNRSENSSKYYKSVPCAISKSLITKYQKNKKCKSVKKCVIPICGDKGRQIKLEPNNRLRIPVITKKQTIPIFPLKQFGISHTPITLQKLKSKQLDSLVLIEMLEVMLLLLQILSLGR